MVASIRRFSLSITAVAAAAALGACAGQERMEPVQLPGGATSLAISGETASAESKAQPAAPMISMRDLANMAAGAQASGAATPTQPMSAPVVVPPATPATTMPGKSDAYSMIAAQAYLVGAGAPTGMAPQTSVPSVSVPPAAAMDPQVPAVVPQPMPQAAPPVIMNASMGALATEAFGRPEQAAMPQQMMPQPMPAPVPVAAPAPTPMKPATATAAPKQLTQPKANAAAAATGKSKALASDPPPELSMPKSPASFDQELQDLRKLLEENKISQREYWARRGALLEANR